MLVKLSSKDHNRAAQLLADYWSSRGVTQYDQKWALAYLSKGHRIEVVSDEFFVLREKSEIIGIASLITDVSGVAEIRDEVVKPKYRGRGYGKILLREIVKLAKKRKIRKLFALTFPRYQKFYLSVGFKKEGLLKNHFAKGENLVTMSCFPKHGITKRKPVYTLLPFRL